MKSVVRKILTYTIAIYYCCWFAQSAIAGALSDRIAAYPNWNYQPQLQQHEGELTYPDWFQGQWIAKSTLLEQIAPLAPEVVTPGFESNRQYINKPIEFTVRFVTQILDRSVKISPLGLPKQKVNLPAKIIADRAFNGSNIAAAYLGAANVKSVIIDPQNPTKQITKLTEDRELSSFVTGHEIDRTDATLVDRFTATELSQQVFKTSVSIYLNTVETTTSYQFYPTPTPKITATQISAIYLSPQDPDYFRTIDRNLTGKLRNRPVALYKYRLELNPKL
jgi:hypothetical protein